MNLFVFNQIQQRPLVVLYGAPTLYGSQCGSVHKNIIPLLHSFRRRDSIVGAGQRWQRLNSPLPALRFRGDDKRCRDLLLGLPELGAIPR